MPLNVPRRTLLVLIALLAPFLLYEDWAIGYGGVTTIVVEPDGRKITERSVPDLFDISVGLAHLAICALFLAAVVLLWRRHASDARIFLLIAAALALFPRPVLALGLASLGLLAFGIAQGFRPNGLRR